MSQVEEIVQEEIVQLEKVETCPVCHSARRLNLYRSNDWLFQVPGEFPLVECRECGAVYLGERPTAESLGAYYPSNAYYAYKAPVSYSLFGSQNRVAAIWYAWKKSILAHDYNYRHLGGSKLLASLARLPVLQPIYRRATFELDALLHPYVENGSLLDVGCGSGMYLSLMRELGWKRVTGVDVSAEAIQQAKDILGLEAYCGHLKDVGLEPDSFDAVSLSHTLEHVADPVEFLTDIKRVMKPGGQLAIVVPNVGSLSSHVFDQYWRGLEPPRHLVNFSKRSLGTALERAGFDIKILTTTPRAAYWFALLSYSRQAGDKHSQYSNFEQPFRMRRRTRAFLLSWIEHVQCAVGQPAGEELMAVAVKPHSE